MTLFRVWKLLIIFTQDLIRDPPGVTVRPYSQAQFRIPSADLLTEGRRRRSGTQVTEPTDQDTKRVKDLRTNVVRTFNRLKSVTGEHLTPDKSFWFTFGDFDGKWLFSVLKFVTM